MKNFYELLSLPPDAPADEIKKAFRREIGRYHPDKVQHLGREFQDMAANIAADLTEAYRILMDPELRAKYNEDLLGGAPADQPATPPPPSSAAGASPQPQPPPSASAPPPPASSFSGATAPPRPSSTAGVDFVKKASLSRFKDALEEVFGGADASHVSGFDVAVTSKSPRALFKKADERVRLLAKFVPLVDAAAVEDIWPKAMKARAADVALCVLLMGPALAPSKDLAAAITEQRRRARQSGPVLVPVDVRDWEALFPPDTPALVRTLIQRLKEENR